MAEASITANPSPWNGPICNVCGARYLGHHTCSQADIIRRIRGLLEQLDRLGVQPQQYDLASPTDRTAGCPCRRENGGSGVCGCVLSGPTVTC